MGKLFRQSTIFDSESGEVISEHVSHGSANGSGWVIMYTDKISELAQKCTSAATLRVFMLLAAGQKFEERGMVTTKKAVQEYLGITKQTCLEAFKWLKDNMVINETRINGVPEFMVNPIYVTVGRDKKKRNKEWVRRWTLNNEVKMLPSEVEDVKVVKPRIKKSKAGIGVGNGGRSIEVD